MLELPAASIDFADRVVVALEFTVTTTDPIPLALKVPEAMGLPIPDTFE